MKNALSKKLYKNEIIMEQIFDDKTNSLYIITKLDGKWTLYNYTDGKKITTSKDHMTMREKLPSFD